MGYTVVKKLCSEQSWVFPGGSVIKNPLRDNPAKNTGDTGDAGQILRSGRSLEKEMATHSSILTWRTPRTEESCRLQVQRGGHN